MTLKTPADTDSAGAALAGAPADALGSADPAKGADAAECFAPPAAEASSTASAAPAARPSPPDCAAPRPPACSATSRPLALP